MSVPASRLGRRVELGGRYDRLPIRVADPAEIRGKDIVIGDIHASALALTHHLMASGIMKLDATNEANNAALYAELADCYRVLNFQNYSYRVDILRQPGVIAEVFSDPSDAEITRALNRFIEIIDNAEITNHGGVIRLLGDLLADRGANDYLILRMLAKLKRHNINYEINLSNHDMIFLQFLVGNRLDNSVDNDQQVSLHRMLNLISRNIINIDDIRRLARENYLPHLKTMSYKLQEDGTFDVYSHGAISLKQLEYIRHLLPDVAPDSNPEMATKRDLNNIYTDAGALRKVIDSINQIFATNYASLIQQYDLHSLDVMSTYMQISGREPQIESTIFSEWFNRQTDVFKTNYWLYKLIWQRYAELAAFENARTTDRQVSYPVHRTTGHDLGVFPGFTSMDNGFGKFPHNHSLFQNSIDQFPNYNGFFMIGADRVLTPAAVVGSAREAEVAVDGAHMAIDGSMDAAGEARPEGKKILAPKL